VATNKNKIDPRSTRLVCAKLYEGGLLSSYEIFNSIKRRPFKGKSPEFELDIDNITQHAEVAFTHHIQYTLIAIVLSFLALISDPTLSIIFSIPAICLLSLKRVWDRAIALKHFSKGNYDSEYNLNKSSDESNFIIGFLKPFCNWIIRNDIIPEKGKQKDQNVVLFGDYFPFLGAGKRTRNWNFVTDLSKPKKNLDLVEPQNNQENGNKTSELSLRDLYEAVYKKINSKNLPNLSYKFILFADGNKEDEVNFLLKDRLKPCAYDEKLQALTDQLINESVESAQPENIESFFEICKEGIFKDYRTYFNISHHDKNRSTLLSTFLRFSKIENELFAECSFYVLTPIDENIYNIDKLSRNNSSFTVKSILITAGLIMAYILFYQILSIESRIPALFLLIFSIRPLIEILAIRAKETEYDIDIEEVKRGEPHNYGLLKTFRETISSPDYKNYFSAQDIILIQNTIENAIVDAVADFLSAKGIDTSFLRSEMVSFINKGIMQFGGKMENSEIFFGDKNKIVHKMQQVAQKVISVQKEA